MQDTGVKKNAAYICVYVHVHVSYKCTVVHLPWLSPVDLPIIESMLVILFRQEQLERVCFSQARIEWTKNYILMYSCSYSLQIHVHPPLVSPHPLKKRALLSF